MEKETRSNRTIWIVLGVILVLACCLVLAMVVSVSGLLGATGTSISITSPIAGASVKGTITVQASVRTDDRISYVILGVDQDRPQSSNSAPFSFALDTRELTDGPHRLYVEAYDRYEQGPAPDILVINRCACVQKDFYTRFVPGKQGGQYGRHAIYLGIDIHTGCNEGFNILRVEPGRIQQSLNPAQL